MLEPGPSRIVIVYGEWQTQYEMLKKARPEIEFIKGPMPEKLYDTFDPHQRNLLVLDDQMTDAGNSNQLEKYFIQGSHHRNLSIVFIVQNLFSKGKAMRTTNLNSNYLVVFKNPRDKGQMGVLGRQMYPSKWRSFLAVLESATEKPFSYLLIDLMPTTEDEFRLRSNIFPSDSNVSTDVYIMIDG